MKRQASPILVESVRSKKNALVTSTNFRTLRRLAWLALLALSAFYLYRAVAFRFLTPGRLGPDLFNKQVWYFGHLFAALPVLIGAPLQFLPSLRTSRPALHRLIGRVYVAGASMAAVTAIYLGATIEYEGSRLPIVLLGCLWLFFTLRNNGSLHGTFLESIHERLHPVHVQRRDRPVAGNG